MLDNTDQSVTQSETGTEAIQALSLLRAFCVSFATAAEAKEDSSSARDATERVSVGQPLPADIIRRLCGIRTHLNTEPLHTSTAGAAGLGLDGGSEGVRQADREALDLLFPAMHHRHVYRDSDAFIAHCLGNDHMLLCEDEPLIPLEEQHMPDDLPDDTPSRGRDGPSEDAAMTMIEHPTFFYWFECLYAVTRQTDREIQRLVHDVCTYLARAITETASVNCELQPLYSDTGVSPSPEAITATSSSSTIKEESASATDHTRKTYICWTSFLHVLQWVSSGLLEDFMPKYNSSGVVSTSLLADFCRRVAVTTAATICTHCRQSERRARIHQLRSSMEVDHIQSPLEECTPLCQTAETNDSEPHEKRQRIEKRNGSYHDCMNMLCYLLVAARE